MQRHPFGMPQPKYTPCLARCASRFAAVDADADRPGEGARPVGAGQCAAPGLLRLCPRFTDFDFEQASFGLKSNLQ